MKRSDYSDLFLAESREHVSTINESLLSLETDPRNAEAIASVFRSVHTIKGMAAAMQYSGVSDLAHAMEQLLDPIRSGEQAVEDDSIQLLLSGADAIERGIELAVVGEGADFAPTTIIRRLIAAAEVGTTADASLSVSVQVDTEAPLPGVRAYLALRTARAMGLVMGLQPPERRLGDEDFSGELSFWLDTDESAETVRERLLALGDVREVTVQAATIESTHQEGRASTDGIRLRGRHIRVDLHRLDRLVNQVGELVLIRDRLRNHATAMADTRLDDTVDQASRLIGEVRDEVMRVRMVPAGYVFDRFTRLVRDAARALGKRVDFIVEGAQIELDRTLLDEIGDPLVHLLRNAVDHGIETPAERIAAGKSEVGTLRLEVMREGSGALVRLSDDGRGISRDEVLSAAVARGIVTKARGKRASDEEIYRLLTRPGFSTSKKVTAVSGRGVGLDVVANRVRALSGSLDISGRPGDGATFEIRLPLTLAILRAMLVRCAGSTYALPLAYVSETAELPVTDIHATGSGEVVHLRGEAIPLVRLDSLLGLEPPPRGANLVVVVLEVGEQFMGLEIDDFTGQQEIVVKDFDSTMDTLRIFSGATILTDGQPSLILDADSLFARAAGAAILNT